jgi:hypothetical protein
MRAHERLQHLSAEVPIGAPGTALNRITAKT